MTMTRWAALAATATLPLLLAGCEWGPKQSTQLGPRGAGMEQVANLNLVTSPGVPPASAYPLATREGQRAREIYPELKELGDLSVEEFGLLMANITAWVVPADAPASEQGCNYCHNPENMASYEKYTKTVSLSMLRMTRNINVNWQAHVQQTGVTCYTCHRGKAIPAYSWSFAPDQRTDTILGNRHGQNAPAKAVGYASLPNDPNGWYFVGDRDIRVAGEQIHPGGQAADIKDAEATYGLMMRVSGALGVNCTFCHNSHNFGDWNASRLQRVTAWHGIRMVRNANESYIQPLQTVFPATGWDGQARLGPGGDPLKINCQTCHQGHPKPLGGVSMLADNPSLAELAPPAPAAAAPASGTVIVAGAVRTTDRVVGAVAAVPAATAAAVVDRVQAVRERVAETPPPG
jgi:photosynthetic reaction center cytochrome c subunit